MKRKLFGKAIKQTFLTVPAAALMLGASQAQTTIGINFSGGAYANYVTQYGASCYSGFPVTAKAFGIDPSNWYTSTNGAPATTTNSVSAGVPYSYAANGSMVVGSPNAVSVSWTSPDTWGTHIGFNQAVTNNLGQLVPPPGNDQVTWGFLDNGSWTASLSGLNTAFPNGYVIQCIAAAGDTGSKVSSSSQVTDGATFTNGFNIYSVNGVLSGGGTAQIGLMIPSPTLTSDSVTLSDSSHCGLCGFIVTDEPVVSWGPFSVTNDEDSTLILSAQAIGVSPLSYQWRFNGVPILGATFATYTNLSLATTDAGNYDVVVTNLYGSTTSGEATVTVNQAATLQVDLPTSVTNYSTLNARFTPVVGGAPPLTYIWTKDGAPLANTNATLDLTNLQASDAGAYQVVVTNAYGAVTSSVANLTVIPSSPPYEGFDYSAGDVNGQNGGVGWGGAWNLTGPNGGGHSVITPGLSYSPSVSSLVVTGGTLATATIGSSGEWDDSRSLLGNIGGPGCGTLYFSFIGQFTNSGWETISFTEGTNSFDSLPFVGQGWYDEGWGAGSPNSFPYSDFYATNSPSTALSFVVYRFDFTPTNTQVKIYVNPSSLASEPATPTASGALNSSFQFDGLLIRAHQSNGSTANDGMPCGVLDELRFGGTWASVAPYVARTSPPFTLQMQTGGVIQDTKPTGTPHDGLNYGTSWLASSTDFNSVTRSGVEQFVETNNSQIAVPANPDFNTTNGTICFWMNYNFPLAGLPGPGSESAMLFDCRTTSGTIIALNAQGSIQFQALSGARFAGSASVADGNWHHVAVTYDQSSNGVVAIYVDGVLDTQLNNPNAWSWPTNQEIELGRSHDPYWKIYDGQMDDFRIYNQELNASQVAAIAAGDDSNLTAPSNMTVRFNFNSDSAFFGESVGFPYGILQSSPTLGSGAVWTSITNAVSPQPIIPSAPTMFYRLTGTP